MGVCYYCIWPILATCMGLDQSILLWNQLYVILKDIFILTILWLCDLSIHITSPPLQELRLPHPHHHLCLHKNLGHGSVQNGTCTRNLLSWYHDSYEYGYNDASTKNTKRLHATADPTYQWHGRVPMCGSLDASNKTTIQRMHSTQTTDCTSLKNCLNECQLDSRPATIFGVLQMLTKHDCAMDDELSFLLCFSPLSQSLPTARRHGVAAAILLGVAPGAPPEHSYLSTDADVWQQVHNDWLFFFFWSQLFCAKSQPKHGIWCLTVAIGVWRRWHWWHFF